MRGSKLGVPSLSKSPSKATPYFEIIQLFFLSQDDYDAWEDFASKVKVELIGEDLLTTNSHRIITAESQKACNALLLKINESGIITPIWRIDR